MGTINKNVTLGSIVTVKKGLSTPYLKDGDTEVKLIKVKDIGEDGQLMTDGVDAHVVKKTAAFDKATVRQNDLLISLKGTSFKIALVPKDAVGFVISANIIALSVNDVIRPEIVGWYLASSEGMRHIQRGAMGTTLITLNVNHLLDLPIPVPSPEKQEMISYYLHTLTEYKEIIRQEQEMISKISEALLDALIRGD